ncbi:MAG TPA: hypothetical protein VMN58_10405 [Acidimicrobiales bacterium]|nr:hypothetical protein [Acidimicrobiales bacterium]
MAALAAVSACGGDAAPDSAPVTTLPIAPTTTSTTVGVDEIPDEITVEYVQRVMDALDESWGEMFRQYKADEGPTVDNHAWLAELYAEPAYGQMEDLLGEIAGDEFDGIREEPSDPVTEVLQVVSATPECIFVSDQRDYGGIFSSGYEVSPGYLQLVPAPTQVSIRNPTAWRVSREVTAEGRTVEEVIDPCGDES